MNEPGPETSQPELERLRDAYRKRQDHGRYALDNPAQRRSLAEAEEGIRGDLALHGWCDLGGKRALDVGCGGGYWLGRMLEWGAEPRMLAGIDAIESRIRKAQEALPVGCDLRLGDAAALPYQPGEFDLISQFVVFSSILDPQIRARVASEMDRVLRPGGCLLWYDFFRDNPRNPDVAAVRRNEIEALFPGYRLGFHRVTLAPPLARTLARISPRLMSWVWRLPFLRTHYLVIGWKKVPNELEN